MNTDKIKNVSENSFFVVAADVSRLKYHWETEGWRKVRAGSRRLLHIIQTRSKDFSNANEFTNPWGLAESRKRLFVCFNQCSSVFIRGLIE